MIGLLAALDVDRVTDVVGIPLAALLVGLLILIDLVALDADGLRVPTLLARRRTLVSASVVVGLVLVAILASRIMGMTA